MEIGLIINVVALLVELLDVIRDSCKDGASKRLKHCQAELHLFHTQLSEKLQFANRIKEQAGAVGFKSESLEKLQNELQKFVSSAQDLLSSKKCKKKDIQELRELAMGTLQYQMQCIEMEMCIKGVKAIKEMMEQQMVPKNHGVQLNIVFQSGNPMLASGPRPFNVTVPTSCQCHSNVLNNLVVPTQASKYKAAPYTVPLLRVPGMIELGVEESGRIKGAAAEYIVPQDKAFLINMEEAGAAVFEEKKREEEAALVKKDMGRPTSAAKYIVAKEEEEEEKKKKEWLNENCQDNPNRNMQLTEAQTTGELLASEYIKGSGQWKVTYKWREESSVGNVIGIMELNMLIGYFYMEVKLVEMAEGEWSGVGVGVARSEKFKAHSMVGKYPKSCGYDGRVGEVYYENKVRGGSAMGHLAKGDTIGIGILQHNHQHCIFFTLNGKLGVCIQDDSLCKRPSRHGPLLPVISLASARVQVHVNFRGRLSDLLAQEVKNHLSL